MNFSFVSRMSFPTARPAVFDAPELAFSADGSNFAMTMCQGRVIVWDIRSKVPLKILREVPNSDYDDTRARYLQFSNGNLGKDALVYVEVCLMFTS